ncbi:hypothetical protein SeMB42_g05180 [Synchytrium endobioticum]|uniref:Uncharacterized protein n=1 Tax=Synchytrium endobioticum TaxID=286115 RepID=A0A507CTB8_9FUNG|nr:hypothetical protein SeMB42_g05180 [Synchytrium endobioticum]
MYPHNLLKVMPPVDHCPRLSSRHQLMDPRDCPDLNALVTERERSAAFDRNYQGIADMVQNWISQADRLNLLCNQYSRDINFLRTLQGGHAQVLVDGPKAWKLPEHRNCLLFSQR